MPSSGVATLGWSLRSSFCVGFFFAPEKSHKYIFIEQPGYAALTTDLVQCLALGWRTATCRRHDFSPFPRIIFGALTQTERNPKLR